MSLPLIQYPYTAPGRKYEYVPSDNAFMMAAKQGAMGHGCRKHATGAVAVRDGRILVEGNNAGTHVSVCPRIYKGYRTGQGYRYCKEYCDQEGHSEVMVCKKAKEQAIDLRGADVYLFGHWWCCENCWNHMIEAGIDHVYLMDKSDKLFNDQEQGDEEIETPKQLSVYISGPLTHLKNPDIKLLYERLGELAESKGWHAHVPHKYTDPLRASGELTSEKVYEIDSGGVRHADLVICYVGEPSLGVGMELEMANRYKTLVVLISEEDIEVSRLTLGSPSVLEHITFLDQEDALKKVDAVYEKFMAAAKKPNVSIK